MEVKLLVSRFAILVTPSPQYCIIHSQSLLLEPAPEVLLKREYDGKVADVWSCGVTLYIMLVGAYSFEDPNEPKNFWRTIQRVLNVQYSIPDYVHVSPECGHLISRIFEAGPAKGSRPSLSMIG
ncbi:hypothetical protein SAY87_014382 [Trapa incisa]|uniref:Protein kinase domain-containing protein n=1 Tax=Trapa incisa TaxID=236973 RepID=A0AAN7GNK2_9MYRT|nr:hypothetical protein SAY87_014382 [Trapa incisa]